MDAVVAVGVGAENNPPPGGRILNEEVGSKKIKAK
jgi:hypothetical protein